MCCPSVGGGLRILGLASENFTGGLTSFMGPQEACLTSVTISRAMTIGSQLSNRVESSIRKVLTMIVLERRLHVING